MRVCEDRGWSLPTTAEFEWAITGGRRTLFHWGDLSGGFLEKQHVDETLKKEGLAVLHAVRLVRSAGRSDLVPAGGKRQEADCSGRHVLPVAMVRRMDAIPGGCPHLPQDRRQWRLLRRGAAGNPPGTDGAQPIGFLASRVLNGRRLHLELTSDSPGCSASGPRLPQVLAGTGGGFSLDRCCQAPRFVSSPLMTNSPPTADSSADSLSSRSGASP